MNIFFTFAGLLRNALLYCSMLMILWSCKDTYSYVSRKGTLENKYEFAKKSFNKKKYSKAQPLLEEIYPQYKGKKEAEEVYYMLAYSHYKLSDFLLASYHFQNFTQQYSLSVRVEECSYLHCICEFQKSLPPYLDQTITDNAIKEFQIFVNNFPDSKYMGQCNDYIDKLRAKLHEKSYNNAMLYYRIGDYKAAIVAFQNSINDYPDLPQKEEFEYLIVKANYQYAKNSIAQFQIVRYKKALEAADEFFSEHSQSTSEFANQVKQLVVEIKSDLQKAEQLAAKKNNTTP